MKIKEVKASVILNSREEETIEITVNNVKESRTSAPSGKSKGRHEKPAYVKDVHGDEDFINKLKVGELPEINEFENLEELERKLANKIGANTLFALEASILKALAKERKLELWQLLNINAKVFPRIISNIIGGGLHSENQAKIKPDFQEFLAVCNKNPAIAQVINKKAYDEAGEILQNLTASSLKKNDENAWITDEDNEQVLEVMKDLQENIFEDSGMHLDIGLDVAASTFFKNRRYMYKNIEADMNRKEQISYIIELAKKYALAYLEDPLNEEDFDGFAEIKKNTNCLIVGDDLTVTNLERVKRAIELGAVNGVIIKPNQTGSLLEVKKVIDFCKENRIYTIMSHRSGETLDNTIADLAFAWQCDFIKIPVFGPERLAKVNRLVQIEQRMKVVKI